MTNILLFSAVLALLLVLKANNKNSMRNTIKSPGGGADTGIER